MLVGRLGTRRRQALFADLTGLQRSHIDWGRGIARLPYISTPGVWLYWNSKSSSSSGWSRNRWSNAMEAAEQCALHKDSETAALPKLLVQRIMRLAISVRGAMRFLCPD
jgi:hypothetical protein